MAVDLKKLLDEAMNLPTEARAALAGELIESLDSAVDENAEVEWANEIGRRLAEIDSGAVKPISWPDAKKVLRRSR